MAENPKVRTPIVCVMGHVDHGKTSLLDRIRGSSVVTSEVGAITQHIGATIVPIDAIRSMGGTMGKSINIPGLLFIDTPGHHAFTTLRARGGALADMAILVVDINQGFQPQTIEALQILRNCRTPFVVAATKIDRIHGWRVFENESILSSFAKQNDRVKGDLENKTYEIVGKLAELDFSADRFDRISDFKRNLAIVPVSAHTGEGISDLLLVMIGLAQRYMGEELALLVEGPGAGTVLEVKEERGLGTTLDVILYDGTLAVGDEIAVAGAQDAIVVTKVRSLLKPRPMKEILVEDRFERVKSVAAAAGIKVTAPNLENVIAGSPFFVIRGNREEVEARIKKEMTEIHVKLADEGIVIKADTIGALEALCKELEGKGIGVMRAEVGPVSRHDLIDTETIKNPVFRVLLSFNTPILPDAAEMIKDPLYTQVKVFEGRVIYQLIDQYLAWRDEQKRLQEKQRFEHIVMPAKIRLLPDCVFRQSNPAVVGVRVLGGKLRSDVNLIKTDGKKVGHLKSMQLRQESIREADAGLEVAISIEGVTVGRQLNVGDDLFVDIPERHVKVLEKEMLKTLNVSTQEILNEFTTIRRKEDPFWGK
jgi:translation initiation factor 5B